MQGRVALGRRTGMRVRRIGEGPDGAEGGVRGPRHTYVEGFDLHANVAVSGEDRAQVEQLCRYLLRPPLAQERLELTGDGRVLVTLKRAWSDGTTHLWFEPVEFLEKLAALTPRPGVNLVVYHGVLAPHARWRGRVVAYGRPAAGASEEGGALGSQPPPRYWPWAELMRRAFDLDVLACPRCGGRLRLLGTIGEPAVVERILIHLGLSAERVRADPAQPPSAELVAD